MPGEARPATPPASRWRLHVRASRTPRPAGRRRRPAGPADDLAAHQRRGPSRRVDAGRRGCAIGRAAGRQLVDDRDVEVAVDGQGQGARDGGGGHHEHVRRRSPLARRSARWRTPKRCCSSTTASPSRWKRDALLDEGVRARPRCATRPRPAARGRPSRSLPLTRRGEQLDAVGAAGAAAAGRSGSAARPGSRWAP